MNEKERVVVLGLVDASQKLQAHLETYCDFPSCDTENKLLRELETATRRANTTANKVSKAAIRKAVADVIRKRSGGK